MIIRTYLSQGLVNLILGLHKAVAPKMESKKKSCPHGLINYIDTKAKCRHLKK
jgi:hypothetical protein